MRGIDRDISVKKPSKYQWFLVIIFLTIIEILGLFGNNNLPPHNSFSTEFVATEHFFEHPNKIDSQTKTHSPSFFSPSYNPMLGSIFFVSLEGSDENPGTIDLPWKTLKFASKQIGAGDTLNIREGIYQEYFRITNNGTPSAPITLINYNNEEVIIDGNNNKIPEKNSGTPLLGLYGNWIVIRNLTIRYSGAYGIYSIGTNVTLDNLYIHHWNHSNKAHHHYKQQNLVQLNHQRKQSITFPVGLGSKLCSLSRLLYHPKFNCLGKLGRRDFHL